MRKKTQITAIIALLVALSIASCGSGAGDKPSSTLVSMIGTNPPHFNQYLTTEIATSAITPTIYEPLVRTDEDYQPQPALAKSWDVSDDAKEYTFHLRENVEWSDGKPLTSDDVKYTFDTYLELGPISSIYADQIEQVTTPDEHTVKVTFKEQFSPFIRALAEDHILPKHIFDNDEEPVDNSANLNPVGTGPYKLKDYAKGDKVVVTRNDNYWGHTPSAKKIVFKIAPESRTRTLALKSGDADFINASYIDASDLKQEFGDESKYNLYSSKSGISIVTAHLNSETPLLSTIEGRTGLFQAINRKEVAEKAYYGYAKAARGIIPRKMDWATTNKANFLDDMPYDPETARDLLNEASGGLSKPLRLAYPSNFPAMESVAGVLKSNLEDVGLKVKLIGEDFDVWTDRTYKKHDFDISIVFLTTYEDPSLGVTRIYKCNPTDAIYNNPSSLCSKELDTLFEEAASLVEDDDRARKFGKAESLVEKSLSSLPIVEQESYHVGRKADWDFSGVTAVQPDDWSALKVDE